MFYVMSTCPFPIPKEEQGTHLSPLTYELLGQEAQVASEAAVHAVAVTLRRSSQGDTCQSVGGCGCDTWQGHEASDAAMHAVAVTLRAAAEQTLQAVQVVASDL